MRLTTTTLEAIEKAALTRSFAAYVKGAWRLVCAEDLEWSWHMDLFCSELQRVAEARHKGEGVELVICIPPGMTKSLIVSVLWQTWVWTWWPESRWITCTYEQDLASDLSQASLDVVRSEWYQKRWPLELKRDAARHWTNTLGGMRRAVGTGGTITGKHAHFHVGDDLVKEQDSRVGSAQSIAAALAKATGFWWGALATRVIEVAARVMVGQRLHRDDPPGVAIRKGYESIVLRMEYRELGADSRDQRTYEGELLHEARFPQERVDKMRQDLGPAAAAAQLDMDPEPPGGQLLKPEYLSHRYKALPAKLQGWLDGDHAMPRGTKTGIYGDGTFKGKPTSDFVVYQFWARFESEYWLIDQVRGQWGFNDACQQLRDFIAKHSWVKGDELVPKAMVVKLEDAANAPAMEDALKDEIPELSLSPMAGGCLARQQQVEGQCWAAGIVHLPADAPWMPVFLEEHAHYDGLGTRHDDTVSTSGTALMDLRGRTAEKWKNHWEKALR